MLPLDMLPRRIASRLFSLLICLVALGCPGASTDGGGGGADDSPTYQPDPHEPHIPDAEPAVVDANPTRPTSSSGVALGWSTANELRPVFVARGRDSAVILVPAVTGAHDYRALVLDNSLRVEVDAEGREWLRGATVFCSGLRQENAPARNERLVMREIHVAGLTERSRIVIEAVDTSCPFTGVVGPTHVDIQTINEEVPPADRVAFSIFTEAEIRQRYDSLIINGHGTGARLADQALPIHPRVLARTTVVVDPRRDVFPAKGFFEGFEQPQAITWVRKDSSQRTYAPGDIYRMGNLRLYTYNTGHHAFFTARGQLRMVLADWAQDVFSTAIVMPDRTAQLSYNDYLHVTFEVPSNSTTRRYWWFSLCGAGTAGQTLDADGFLTQQIAQTSFFYQPDGRNPSVAGWNCLQIFPRDGSPFPLEPDDTRPQSDLRVMVNIAGRSERSSVVNVSPAQYNRNIVSPGWFRQRNARGDLVAAMLDDRLTIEQPTRYDLYIRRDRVVVYVGGEQRLCNDFASVPLTMAEGAIGFGDVLYHSAAERLEFSWSFNLRTGQQYYLHNTPYIEARSYDNLGFDEHVGAPPDFDPQLCYAHAN